MKVLTVVGARPQLIKAAAVSRVLRNKHNEVLVHTGQHYDENMSDVFFKELEIPPPDYNLRIGSGSHGSQTGAMLVELEKLVLAEKPNMVLVYGDTNSTLAGALVAAKCHIPIAHVEAGLRSFNRNMPEEVNRVLVDHVSSLLFCPSRHAVNNLANEGITKGVHIVGDVMHDALMYASKKSLDKSQILMKMGVQPGKYLLATIHRAENTDSPTRLKSIMKALAQLSRNEQIVFPVHPRTRRILGGITRVPGIIYSDPVGYLDMVRLEASARMILTDSGGIQKEAYWLKVPCLTLRDETEWVETVKTGWNIVTGIDSKKIVASVSEFSRPNSHRKLYVTNSKYQSSSIVNLMR